MQSINDVKDIKGLKSFVDNNLSPEQLACTVDLLLEMAYQLGKKDGAAELANAIRIKTLQARP